VNVTGGSATNYGGGIQMDGTLTFGNASISDNNVGFYGSGLAVMSGSANLSDVTLSGNTTSSGHAGAIYAQGNINLTNVTISGNSATLQASALMVNSLFVDVTANLTNVTISANTSGSGTAVQALGAPKTSRTINLSNSIIASQTGGSNCGFFPGTTVVSQGGNLDSDNTCQLNHPTDHPNVNPLLGPLALRAPGTTMTHSLGVGSPAIDNGDDAACPLADQRGVVRPLGVHCDIGAYERVPDLTQGDVDCSGTVNAVDALKILRAVAALSVSQTQPCPPIGANVSYFWGDVDCKGEPTSVDALLALRHNAGLSVQQQEPCPDLGTVIPGG